MKLQTKLALNCATLAGAAAGALATSKAIKAIHRSNPTMVSLDSKVLKAMIILGGASVAAVGTREMLRPTTNNSQTP